MKSILIVEDHPEGLYLLKQLFSGQGFKVLEATNGEDAIRLARETSPDLAITDLLMPVMDGFTLLREWKADAALRRIPIIIYTGTYTEPEDEALARDLGADAFITKPMDPDAIFDQVSEIMNRPAPAEIHRESTRDHEEIDQLRTYSEILSRKLGQHSRELDKVTRDLAAREEELKLQKAALESTVNAIVITDLEGHILWANPAFSKVTGYTLDEAVGQRPAIIQSGIHEPAFYERMWETILAGKIWQGEVTNRRKDGTVFVEDMTITPIVDDAGKPTHFVAIKQDITERKELERQFLRMQRLDSIGTLAGGIAHDLNNVLTPILLSIDFLKFKLKDAPYQNILENMAQSTRRGADMVKQVLTFARGQEPGRDKVIISDLCRELTNFLRETFPRNIELDIEPDVTGLTLDGDATQIYQVLLNLCLNARDAMKDGGKLTIRCSGTLMQAPVAGLHPEEANGKLVRITVSDTGEGIPEDQLEKIFDPFFTTKSMTGGTGLGLFSSHSIIKNHNGIIRAKSRIGGGTTFEILIPEHRSRPPESTPTGEPENLPRGNGETILLVDDEAAILQATCQILEQFGYAVITAGDGAEAVARYACATDPIDVVVINLRMPVMDGPTAIRTILKMDPDARIITTSGHMLDGRMARAMESGVRHFLGKPYSTESLLKIIRQSLSEHKPDGIT